MDSQNTPLQPEQQAIPQPVTGVQQSDDQVPQQLQNVANSQELFSQIAAKIIEQQEAIIGPIAVEQAKQIEELAINWQQHEVGVGGDPQRAIDSLVARYKDLFGQIAVQVSREAVAGMVAQLPVEQKPKSLSGQ